MEQECYNVTFISDYFVMTIVAVSMDSDTDTESAVDIAGELAVDQYGFDPRAYAYDVTVEPAF